MNVEKSLVKRPGWILELTVFVCGAVVMAYEINGSRILAPYIGTSTYIWTSLIGVILGALSVGYWFGGRIADREPNIRVLASAIFVAAGLISFTILIKDIVLQAISQFPGGVEVRSIIAAILLFAPASVALGFVIPYATKLRIADLKESGSVVGRLYALSTVGSIVGTFAAGFVLIPFVGSVRTLYLIAAILFVLSILIAGLTLTRNSVSALLVFVIGISVSEGSSYLLWRSNGLHDIDTEYSRVWVFETSKPESGRKMIAMATDPVYIQSARYLESDELALEYTKFYDLVKAYRPEFKKTLMIGGAGFSYPQAYLEKYQNADIDVVEIDRGMTDIARRFFLLKDDPRLQIFHADGRVFLNSAPAGSYDAILMDAFGSLFSVPFQLTTVEAVREMHRVLKDDGVVIFNIGSAITGDASQFLSSEVATYRQVFSEIHLYKVRPEENDAVSQNLIIVACKTTCPEINESNFSSADPDLFTLLSKRIEAPEMISIPILTDDLAPVERFASIAHSLR